MFSGPTNKTLSLSLSLSAMAEYYFPDLVEAMNHLWFHHIILFSEPMSLLSPKITKPIPEIPLNSPSSTDLSSTPPPEEEISEESSPIPPQDDSNNEDIESNSSNKERPTRLNIVPTKTRSHSSSPLLKKTQKHLRYSSCAGRRLQKTMSCKGLWELEYQEVKGFMDLGFTFKKEHLNPRLMSVIPGLQRLREYEEEQEERQVEERSKEDEIEEEEEEKRGVMRPYLSEAWLIKRPDSPLLDLRIPRASAAADMKKHLRYWARTVASVIQQES